MGGRKCGEKSAEKKEPINGFLVTEEIKRMGDLSNYFKGKPGLFSIRDRPKKETKKMRANSAV